ncbi:MAG: hypothetical protein CM15mP18_1870 [Methanobacteriota archaeon]|nr:MAG: hypothetical protein CM15mP18_1870 [Euryarchaeota archaeon]
MGTGTRGQPFLRRCPSPRQWRSLCLESRNTVVGALVRAPTGKGDGTLCTGGEKSATENSSGPGALKASFGPKNPSSPKRPRGPGNGGRAGSHHPDHVKRVPPGTTSMWLLPAFVVFPGVGKGPGGPLAGPTPFGAGVV